MRRREFLFGSVASVFFVACAESEGELGSTSAADTTPLTPTSAPASSDATFPQGLASGDPRPDRVILWCRAEPTFAGVTAADDVSVGYVVAEDEALTRVVARGNVTALAAEDHTVRVVPTGLTAGRTYWYRFEAGGVTTRVGRTRTAPAVDSDVPVTFAFASCQDFCGRYYHSWQALLDETASIDFILFLGDYVYETVNDPRFQSPTADRSVTLPVGMDTSAAQDGSRIAAATLADYRALYKTYRSDATLREVHRLFPFVVTWDDHEFADDCWQDHSTSFDELDPHTHGFTAEESAPRRVAASRAFSEYQAADIRTDRTAAFPNDIAIYRTVRWGKHVELFMTDQRMYRDDHLIPEGPLDIAVGKLEHNSSIGSRYFVRKSVFDPREERKTPTLLGATQKAWLLDAMKNSRATWKVWGNEVQMYQMALRLAELPVLPWFVTYTVYVNCDQWDGYRSERKEILSTLARSGVDNLLVCTGDIHGFFAAELHADFDAPGRKPVGVEYVTAGISSASLGTFVHKFVPDTSILRPLADAWFSGADAALLATNTHLRHADSDAYGFSLVSIDATRAEVTFVQMPEPTSPTYAGPVARRTFVTRAGENTVVAS